MLKNPEQAYAHKHEQHEDPLTMDEEKAYDIYVPRWQAADPDLDSFKGVYSDIEIQRAKNFVSNQKAQEKDKHERAQLLEALLFHSLEQENWLGDKAFVVRSSEFDDRVNSTDIIIEFNEEGGPVRLAVDITTARNKDTIRSKVQSIKQSIEIGMLTNIKFFRSEVDEDYKGALQAIPRVIVGFEPESVKILSKVFADRHSKVDRKRARAATHAIAQHPLQLKVLEEVSLQLKQQAKQVRENDKLSKDSKDKLSAQIEKASASIKKIVSKKEKSVPSRRTREDRTAELLSTRLEEVWG